MRAIECTTAACTCESAIEVPLRPAIILPRKMFEAVKRVANREGIMIENIIFRKGLKWILEEAQRSKEQ